MILENESLLQSRKQYEMYSIYMKKQGHITCDPCFFIVAPAKEFYYNITNIWYI